jgi:AraC-like DNA-binding protein
MVTEPGGTCTVVRAVDRRGERQTCWRVVEESEGVAGDVRCVGPDVDDEIMRATVGLVRVGEPNAGRSAAPRRPDRERYRLIVQTLSETGEGVSTVLLDVLAVKLADRPTDGVGEMQDGAVQDVLVRDARRGGLLGRIHAFIDAQLGDPELTPAAVAAAHHISLRYLHKLFEPEPQGVAGMIRQRRLERCRHDLLDPAQADRPVAGIAARWGFSSAAHFSRVFRDAYGLPPAEFRRFYRLGAAS